MPTNARSSTADLEDAREKLIQAFAPLSDDLLDTPDVVGAWSVRACLAHILTWDTWGCNVLAAMTRGEAPAAPTEASINGRATELYGNYDIAEFQKTLRKGREQLLERLAAMSDDERDRSHYKFDGKLISANYFVDGFIEHDREHASEIRAWRKAQGI